MQIDLNCDMGESFGRYALGDDDALLDTVTSANIACGLHAGDPVVLAHTVRQAVQKSVSVGAHPGYPDLQGFGRRVMDLPPTDLSAFILYQIGALSGFVRAEGTRLTHVKPHGALYNVAARDSKVAQAVLDAVWSFDPSLIIVTLPHCVLHKLGDARGMRVAKEGFADRAYQSDGSLVPRGVPGAVIHDPEQIAIRAVRMITLQEVQAISGEIIPLAVDTLCIHGDTPGAPHIARVVRAALEKADITLAALTT